MVTDNKMSDIVKRLNKSIAVSEIIGDNPVLIHDAVHEIEGLREEVQKLRMAMFDIYEVYAGSEGYIIQNPTEAYIHNLMMQMIEIAAEHKL